MFEKNGSSVMVDWLRVYNIADVERFISAFRKTVNHCYPDKFNVSEEAVSVPGISITSVLNNKKIKLDKARFICA